jgi:hypothetical protein
MATILEGAHRPAEGQPQVNRLRWWNVGLGLLHLAQGTVMLLISTDFALPVTAAFVQFNPATGQLEPALQTLFNLQIGPLVATFLFLSSAAHLLLASPFLFGWYRDNLAAGINRARWIEYSISSSVMIVVIAMLVGIYDIVSLVALFAVNASMVLFGWMMELHNQTTRSTQWTAYIFGCIAGIVPWVGITIYLIGAGGEGGDVPGFVYGIFASLFVFFNIFAINMVLQYRRVGPWRDYLFGETAYMVLSLVAKSALAWQVFAGTLRPV